MVCHVKEHGLTAHSYALRARALADAYAMKRSPDTTNTYIINCEDNVGSAAKKIFSHQFPSYKRVRNCEGGCPDNTTSFDCYEVLKTELISSNFQNLLARLINVSHYRTCQQKNCSSVNEDNDILGE